MKKTKEQKYKDIAIQKNSFQHAMKILANSNFGCMANKYFRYYDANDAEAITATGQAVIQYTAKKLNEYMNNMLNTDNIDYVIAGDTDSIFLTLENIIDNVFIDQTNKIKIIDFIDKFIEKEIQPQINKICNDFAHMINSYEQKLVMKREKICSSGIWIAKKKYVVDVWDEEGVRFSEPKIKVTGLEAVRSSSPEMSRNKLKKAYEIVLREDENTIQQFVKDFRKEFYSAHISDISFPRGLGKLDKFIDEKDICAKGTPIHVRGAIYYNKLLKELELDKKYPLLTNKDKIKFVYLKSPNPIGSHVIAFKDIIPAEFELDKYIDKDQQFEKTFLNPLQVLLKVVGWNYEKKSSLCSFMIEED